jgi:hypothetical protein
MQNQSCTLYRGYTIDVRVVPSKSAALGGQQVRFAVSWLIHSADPPASAIANLPEQLHFFSQEAAFAYAERQAQSFIDGCRVDPIVNEAR